jgi:hypothetical protein
MSMKTPDVVVSLLMLMLSATSSRAQTAPLPIGGGYEIPRNLHLALTSYASYLATPGGNITNSQDRLGGSLLQGGVALAWR